MARYKLSLSSVFALEAFRKVWKQRVWPGLKQQKCRDFIEYYDYNRSISVQARRLQPPLVSGNYRASSPLTLEVGKSDQLVRRVQIPHPDDALIFQIIAESFLPLIRKRQKAKNAFFSRSHAEPKGIHTGHMSLDYPWFTLWPRYQTKILDFAKAKKHVVTTDIQNFFDSVSHGVIRRALAPLDPQHTLTDLTLYLLEEYCRQDFYSPASHRGLPQLDFDAPKMLAHLILFPADAYLERATGGSFTRWVDDINFAVPDLQAAREILRGLERVMDRLELRLGGRKTEILDEQKAEQYLQVDQNRRLDEYKFFIDEGLDTVDILNAMVSDFFNHRSAERYGHWDKVLKRYYNLFTASRMARNPAAGLRALNKRIESASHRDFLSMPDHQFRLTITRYWKTLPPTKARIAVVMKYLRGMSKYDDVVTYSLAELLVGWQIPPRHVFVVLNISKIDSERPGGFLAQALLLAKYGNEDRIVDFVLRTERYWSRNDFLCRQVISLWSLLNPESPRVRSLENQLTRKQFKSVNNLFDFFNELRTLRRLDFSLWGYLSPKNMVRPYYLSKAIVASNVLRSLSLAEGDRSRLVEEITDSVKDRRLRDLALNRLRR